jgi:alpha-L-fucosidase
MSHSFGYNRNDTDSDYESEESLLHGLIDAVAKNGNLLLNVGPRGVDAQIPGEQVQRLQAMGAWLASNGEAIYGTRPWVQAEGRTDQELEVRFTQKGGEIYAIILGTPKSLRLGLLDMPLGTTTKFSAMHLASAAPVKMLQQSVGVELTFAEPLVDAVAHVIVFSADQL